MIAPRSSFVARLFGTAFLLIHACVVGVLPVAEARADASGLIPVAHIEAEGKACVPSHDHAACQVCRVLRLAGTPPAPAPLPPLVACAPRPAALDAVPPGIAAAPELHPTRAPPAA